MTKNLLFILVTILIVLTQISFLNEFGFIRSYINLVLIVTVFLTAVVSYSRGFSFALISGILLDIFSPFTFGINTLALLIPVILIFNLFRKLLARKSIYSLVLVMTMSLMVYHIVLWIFTNIFYWIGWRDFGIELSINQFQQILGQLFFQTIIIIVLWLLVQSVRKLIKSNFLISERI